MPKIDRPFVPQQPGAGTDNYIDGGPTRAGLEELRGKVNAAPTTWGTVAEAEAASYTEPESVVITETGRTYTYSASSGATRDGIRVLTPAGGGRLLMSAPAMTDAEIAAAINTPVITGEPTGFSDSSAVTATHNTANRTITLGGTWKAYYRGVEVVALTSGWTSPAYGSGLSAGAYLLCWNGSSFSWVSLPAANFHDLLICAMVKLASGLCIVLREFHGAELPAAAHMEQHRLAGAYISSGGLLSDWTANSTTAADRRPLISSASFHDEDNVSTISALTSESYTRFYLSGSGAAVNLSVDQADIIPISGNQPYYNQFTAGAWQQTLMPQGKFGAGFVIAMPVVDDQTGTHLKYRWQIVQPQSVQDTQAAAEAVDFASISLGELTAGYPEITARARVVIQYTGSNWVIKSVQTLTGTYIKGFVSSAPLAQVVTDGTTTTGNGTPLSPISAVNVTGYLGAYTTSQIAALTGMSAGNWVRDSSRAYRPVVYNGTFWLPPGHVVLQNRTGAASVAGTAVQLSASYDFAVELPSLAESDTDICGIMVSDGVANGSDVVVDVLGSYFSQVLVVAGDEVVSGYYIVGRSDGLFISRGSARLGSVGRALETKTSASNFLVWVLTSGNETV